jgi:4-amino-4-deoxy-L-arabinose transferase-like glycosyltransferase
VNDEQLLINYLADRDAPCPVCGYNLRGLQRADCPECGHHLVLGVGFTRDGAITHPFAVAPLVIGLGTSALAGVLCAGGISSDAHPVWVGVLVNSVDFVLYGGALWALVARRRRFRRLKRLARLGVVLLCWAFLVAPWVILAFFD